MITQVHSPNYVVWLSISWTTTILAFSILLPDTWRILEEQGRSKGYIWRGAAFIGPHHRWHQTVPTKPEPRDSCISKSVTDDQISQDALECLNSLQTPFAILEERRRLGLKLDASAIDEMRQWVRRAGHEVRALRICVVMISRLIGLRFRN